MSAPPSQSAITTQPSALPGPAASVASYLLQNCPPGLEYLASLNGLFVKQIMEPLEIFAGLETANRYEIFDSFGQRMFYAAEVSHPCVVLLGGKNRPFVIQLLNFIGAPILTLTRDCACSLACGCESFGGNRVVVTHISGEVLGSATQRSSCCTPHFEIRDGDEKLVFDVRGPSCGDCCPFCTMGPCCSANFKITLPEGETEAGVIQKKADLRELVSDANSFGVTFLIPLQPKLKALILGAVFVIDFGYFESSSGGRNRHRQF